MPLVGFRILFGLLMLISTIRFMLKGWVAELYLDPVFHFTYYGFWWVKPVSGPWLYAVFIIIALCCLFVMLGFFYRASITLFFLLFTYVELLDKAYYLNHYYFISVLSFLLIFLPLNRHLSLDALIDPTINTNRVPSWTIWAIRLQVGLVYFFAGLAKLKPDWLFHALPLKIWLAGHTSFPLIGPLFDYAWVAYLMSWSGAIFDLTIPFWLLWRRTRPFAYMTVILFHFKEIYPAVAKGPSQEFTSINHQFAYDVNGDGWIDAFFPTTINNQLLINDGGANHFIKIKDYTKEDLSLC